MISLQQIRSSWRCTGLHGETFHIYNTERFSKYVEDMLVKACDTFFPTDTKEALGDQAVRKDDKDQSCTDVVGVDKPHQWILMEVLGAKKNSVIVRELGERKQKDICFDICSLSRLHTWQSTGIFPRIFQKV